jgi:hypothetical protein
MANAILKKEEAILVVCHDNEVFDEAMKTLAHRFPRATGLVCEPNPGAKMGARNTIVKHYDDRNGQTISLEIMTDAEYQANKAAVDAKSFDSKHTVMWTGGQN